MKKFKKIAVTILKISISLLLLFLVFRKVPFSDIWELIKNSKFFYLIPAFIAFFLSQYVSSERLLLYFQANKFFINKIDNFKLYLVGMFYNFFIPGGIGGDSYKIYLLHKKFDWRIKSLTLSVLCDRISGLLAIIILIELFCLPFVSGYYKYLLFAAIIVTIVLAKFLLLKFFKTFKAIFFRTLLYSLGVQLLQLVTIYFILKSFTEVESIWIYFIVFLISAVLSVISFSGIGVREWLFLKSAHYFTFNSDVSVSTAILFSFITALLALSGIWFQIRKLSIRLTE